MADLAQRDASAAGAGVSEGARRRKETEEERLDRNLMELLQELRVALPGIQVLFAFLLVVPFQQGWVDVTEFEKIVYYVTLLFTAAASICLIAPTARHRIRFRELDKEWIVQTANRLTIVGLAFLALAIAGALLLIAHVVFGNAVAAVTTVVVTGSIAWIWFLAPLKRAAQDAG
jgi:drug/metabolite transporter superfamily protein YnfA